MLRPVTSLSEAKTALTSVKDKFINGSRAYANHKVVKEAEEIMMSIGIAHLRFGAY